MSLTTTVTIESDPLTRFSKSTKIHLAQDNFAAALDPEIWSDTKVTGTPLTEDPRTEKSTQIKRHDQKATGNSTGWTPRFIQWAITWKPSEIANFYLSTLHELNPSETGGGYCYWPIEQDWYSHPLECCPRRSHYSTALCRLPHHFANTLLLVMNPSWESRVFLLHKTVFQSEHFLLYSVNHLSPPGEGLTCCSMIEPGMLCQFANVREKGHAFSPNTMVWPHYALQRDDYLKPQTKIINSLI